MQNLPCNTPLFLMFWPQPEPLFKTEKRKFAFSWEMKSVSGHLNKYVRIFGISDGGGTYFGGGGGGVLTFEGYDKTE